LFQAPQLTSIAQLAWLPNPGAFHLMSYLVIGRDIVHCRTRKPKMPSRDERIKLLLIDNRLDPKFEKSSKPNGVTGAAAAAIYATPDRKPSSVSLALAAKKVS